MPHSTALITTIVMGFVLAFAFGMVAHRFRMPPLVGYLAAGIAMGPFTPGVQGDLDLAAQLSEIGVVLMMFGVGLHFSVKDLLSVRAIAIPGALAQIGIATGLGMALAAAAGWTAVQGMVFGLALSVASTVVMLGALQERRLLDTQRGRVATGWLIVEDLFVVMALVLLPAVSGVMDDPDGAGNGLATALLTTFGKVAAFIVTMLVVGRRVIPWILVRTADTGNRELFRLAVLAISLGFALGCAHVFDVTFSLGAFFAGMLLHESELSHRAAEESLPLRESFAVLFFISAGMLFNPTVVLNEPLLVAGTLLIIIVGKSAAAYLIVRLFGHSRSTALTVGASLAQIGEFSFIIAGAALALGLLPKTASDVILCGAILSILLNPFLFSLLDRCLPDMERREGIELGITPAPVEFGPPTWSPLRDHTVLVGFGRIGHLAADTLAEQGHTFVVIDDQSDVIQSLRDTGMPALYGNALQEGMLEAANIRAAKWLMLAIPDPIEAGQIIRHARELNPALEIVARAHSATECEHMTAHGATHTVLDEREVASALAKWVLSRAACRGVT